MLFRPRVELLEHRLAPANVAVTPGGQEMPSVAVDPHNPDHVVIAYMDQSLVGTGYAGIGVAVSHDGGASWQQTSIPVPADFSQGAANPVVTFDGQSPEHVYVSFMAATFKGNQPALTNPNSPQRKFGFESNNGIFVARSDDGGATWGQSNVATVVSHQYAGSDVYFEIQPQLAIDTYPTLPNGHANPNYGSLYVTWIRAYPNGQLPGGIGTGGATDVMVAVSHDGGANWTTELKSDANGAGWSGMDSVIKDPDLGFDASQGAGRGWMFYPHVSVGPEGDVYVSTFAGGDFTVYHSTDGGMVFSSPQGGANRYVTPAPGISGNSIAFVNPAEEANGLLPIPAMANDNFRTPPERLIVADPARPGHVYAAESHYIADGQGNLVDTGEIVFASSSDYGQTWNANFTVGNETTNFNQLSAADQANFLSALNDDDGGNFLGTTNPPSLANEVVSGQGMPMMAVDAQGNITVIWYDTRRDQAGQLLDVFGTVSTDGGKTFSANFRLTDNSFDPSKGAIPAGSGLTYLGDSIGLAAAGNRIFAAWTDTTGRTNPGVAFTSATFKPAPAPLSDRFEPNDTPATAADLGTVSAQLVVPRLDLPVGDQDWFKLTTGAKGELAITASAPAGGQTLQLQLWDATGTTMLATSSDVTEGGVVTGQQLLYQSSSGVAYFLKVVGGSVEVPYTLVLGSLTADLGTTVFADAGGSINTGEQAIYRVAAPVSGSIDVNITPGSGATGNFIVTILSADGQTVLASGAPGAANVAAAVRQGDVVLIEVSGDATGSGSFDLQVTNPDQFQTSLNQSLFFPVGGTPSSVVVADVNHDGKPDMIVTSSTSDQVSVLLGNGDGTFQAPRTYDVGAGQAGANRDVFREPIVTDLNGDGVPDIAVPNLNSSDVSILLGNGDGTFQPQRRFNSVPSPDSLASGHFTHSGNVDLVALQEIPNSKAPVSLGVMLGRGDGTFAPPITLATPFTLAGFPVRVGDFTGNGLDDLAVFSPEDARVQIWLSNGNGTFTMKGIFPTGELTRNATLVDINHDGKLDIVTTGANTGSVYVMLGNGDGTFQAPQQFVLRPTSANDQIEVTGLSVIHYNGDAQYDVVATTISRTAHGPTELILLPGQADSLGHWTGFGQPQVLQTLSSAGQLATGDFANDGSTDVAVVVPGGIQVFYGKTPTLQSNSTPLTARNLGTVAHVQGTPQAILPGQDAYYTLTVPTEAAPGAGPEVIDFSALFQYGQGGGLHMTVTDANGNVLGSGNRFRVTAAQGSVLTVHVSGLTASAAGAYTLDIDVLPQVVSAVAESPLPGGPATSIVLTFQGDRLDPVAASNPANYTVVDLQGGNGPGLAATIPLASAPGAQAVVYDPGANVDVVSGLRYATSSRQTVTLMFDEPLPPGDYQVTVSPNVTSAAFSAGEAGQLAAAGSVGGHTVVSVAGGTISQGIQLSAPGLIGQSGAPGNLSQFVQGTPFLTQLENDLSALLDQELTQKGDDPGITATLNEEIRARFAALYAGSASPGGTLPSFLISWFDPVSIDVKAPQGQRTSYNLTNNQVSSNQTDTYVNVSGNVEVVVMANASGTFQFGVGDVPAEARGGAVVLSETTSQILSFTDAIRAGDSAFTVEVASAGGTAGGPGSGTTGVGGGPTAATAEAQTAAASALTAETALLVTILLTGVPGESAPSGSATGAGAGPAAVGPATSLAGVNGSIDLGGPSSLSELRGAVDHVFQDWAPGLSVMAKDAWQMVSTFVRRVGGDAADEVASALPIPGLGPMAAGDRKWQDALSNLIGSGISAAEGFARKLASPSPKPPVGAPAGEPRPQAPLPRDDEGEETPDQGRFPEETRGEVRPPADAQQAGAPWGLVLVLAGACHAGWRKATPAGRERRKRQRPPA
jgi:hypothetical protein